MAGRGSADCIGNTAISVFMAGDACDAVQLELELLVRKPWSQRVARSWT